MQLKAAGGVLVIDDFGRQRESPQALINRLIIPLENRRDYLALETGRKFEIPFDALVVFSTNIAPKQLVDEAALWRLRYKILVDRPDQRTMIEIYARTAKRFGLEMDEHSIAFILEELYGKTEGAHYAGFRAEPSFSSRSLSLKRNLKDRFGLPTILPANGFPTANGRLL